MKARRVGRPGGLSPTQRLGEGEAVAEQGALVGTEQVTVDLGDPVALGDGDDAAEVTPGGGDGVAAGTAVKLQPGDVLFDGGGAGKSRPVAR